MTPTELQAWQDRLGISQVEAAKRTKTPVPTYRHYLAGRRRIPANFELLCRHVETFEHFDEKPQLEGIQRLALILASDDDARADMVAAIGTYRSADRAKELAEAIFRIVSPSPEPHTPPFRRE